MKVLILFLLLFWGTNSFSQKKLNKTFKYCKNYRIDNLFKVINFQINSDVKLKKHDTIFAILEYDLFHPTKLFYFGKKNNVVNVQFLLNQSEALKNYTCLKMSLNPDSIILPNFSNIEVLLNDSLFLNDNNNAFVSHPNSIFILMIIGNKCIFNNSFFETTLANDTTDSFLFRNNYRTIQQCIINNKYKMDETYCRDVVLKLKLLYFKNKKGL